MTRKPRKINPDLPSTAISFDKRMLSHLKSIATADDRSLASLVRLAVSEWLQSPRGQQMAEKAQRMVEKAGRRERLVGADAPMKISVEKLTKLPFLTKEILPDDAPLSTDKVDNTPVVGLAELKARLAELEAKVDAKEKGKI